VPVADIPVLQALTSSDQSLRVSSSQAIVANRLQMSSPTNYFEPNRNQYRRRKFPMKNISFSVLTMVLLTGLSLAQTAAQSQASGTAQQQGSTELQTNPTPSQNTMATGEASASGQIATGTMIPAELSKSVDAKKAKPGDQVVAKTTQDMLASGRVVIPRNSKIIGHVTEAKAREKGESESSLGIVFDKVVMRDGHELPLNASIQALAAAQSNTALDNEPMMGQPVGAPGGGAPGRTGGGGMIGGVGRTASEAGGTVANTAGNVGRTAGSTVGSASGVAGNARLNKNSQGVVGLSGLSLNAAADANQGTVISSQNKNVKLDSGTELMLRVNSK
jgi:hypothetical protein